MATITKEIVQIIDSFQFLEDFLRAKSPIIESTWYKY